jgi:hypothetical protein
VIALWAGGNRAATWEPKRSASHVGRPVGVAGCAHETGPRLAETIVPLRQCKNPGFVCREVNAAAGKVRPLMLLQIIEIAEPGFCA